MALDQKLVNQAKDLARTHDIFAKAEYETGEKKEKALRVIHDYLSNHSLKNPYNDGVFRRLLENLRIAVKNWDEAYRNYHKDQSMEKAQMMDKIFSITQGNTSFISNPLSPERIGVLNFYGLCSIIIKTSP